MGAGCLEIILAVLGLSITISAEGLVLVIDFRGGGSGGNSVLHRWMLLLSTGLGSVGVMVVVTVSTISCTGCFMGVTETVVLFILSGLEGVALVSSSIVLL